MSDVETEETVPLEEPEPQAEPTPEEEEAAEEEEATPDTEPEPEAPAEPVDEDRAKLAKGLSTRYETYKASMIKLLGDESPEWIVCPLCTSSMAPGFVNVHDFGRVPDEIRANVDTYFGVAREGEYETAPGITACTDCAGLGKVSTGSRVSDHMTITCPTCKGYGYVPPPGAGAILGAANGTPEAAVAEALADFDVPDRDNWGEPRVLPDGTLNGNYGKMPQFKQVHPVYGVTANLSPEELVSG